MPKPQDTRPGTAEARKQDATERLNQRRTALRNRIDRACLDKLDGKFTEDFWLRKTQEWQQEEHQILMAIKGLDKVRPERALDGAKILKLANKANSL